MKSTIIVLTWVLTAIGCAAPESGYNAPASSEDDSMNVVSRADQVVLMPNAAGGTTTTRTGQGALAAPASAAPSGGEPAASNDPGTPDEAKNADNTKVNERDRGNATLTPTDQGSAGSETRITAAIRKAIMRDDDLSFAAKNVKVITVGTKVTLRGPVESEQEKSVIVALARKTEGVSEVENQLEVKK